MTDNGFVFNRSKEKEQDNCVAHPEPVAELMLELYNPVIIREQSVPRTCASAKLHLFTPENKISSSTFKFRSTIKPVEFSEIAWYFEEYSQWPFGVSKIRAEEIEKELPEIGQDIYNAVFGLGVVHEVVNAWKALKDSCDLRFSVQLNKHAPEVNKGPSNEKTKGKTKAYKIKTEKAETELMSIPWELLHDESSFLFHGTEPIGIKRRFTNKNKIKSTTSKLPVKILLVAPRPENDKTHYVDHRVGLTPLINATGNLGDELISVTTLSPATFPSMVEAIKKADKRKVPYNVIHFDGHWFYDKQKGIVKFSFEDVESPDTLFNRESELTPINKITECLCRYNINLIFIEACQTGKPDRESTTSVAASLIEHGISSVIAITHPIPGNTASIFVQTFYKELVRGERISKAMLNAQTAIVKNSCSREINEASGKQLQDWFAPSLFQNEDDFPLFNQNTELSEKDVTKNKNIISDGEIENNIHEMKHKFTGRGRELLALERLLVNEPYAVIQGPGGIGKTAIATELAHWLVRTGRFTKAAIVTVANSTGIRSVINDIGTRLIPYNKYNAAEFNTNDDALQPIELTLKEHTSIIVIDNLSPVMSAQATEENMEYENGQVKDILDLCGRLIEAEKKTRIVFTTGSELPAPFNKPGNVIKLGGLNKSDAIRLVSNILMQNRLETPIDDCGKTQEEIKRMVNSVNRNASALVTLANKIAAQGVAVSTT